MCGVVELLVFFSFRSLWSSKLNWKAFACSTKSLWKRFRKDLNWMFFLTFLCFNGRHTLSRDLLNHMLARKTFLACSTAIADKDAVRLVENKLKRCWKESALIRSLLRKKPTAKYGANLSHLITHVSRDRIDTSIISSNTIRQSNSFMFLLNLWGVSIDSDEKHRITLVNDNFLVA